MGIKKSMDRSHCRQVLMVRAIFDWGLKGSRGGGVGNYRSHSRQWGQCDQVLDKTKL